MKKIHFFITYLTLPFLKLHLKYPDGDKFPVLFLNHELYVEYTEEDNHDSLLFCPYDPHISKHHVIVPPALIFDFVFGPFVYLPLTYDIYLSVHPLQFVDV